MEVHKALCVGNRRSLKLRDGNQQFLHRGLVLVWIAGEKQIDVVARDDAVLRRLGHLNDRQQRMTLTGMFAHNGKDQMAPQAPKPVRFSTQ